MCCASLCKSSANTYHLRSDDERTNGQTDAQPPQPADQQTAKRLQGKNQPNETETNKQEKDEERQQQTKGQSNKQTSHYSQIRYID